MLNNVQLMGRFTADPEIFAGENYTVCRFTLAVSRDYKNDGGEYDTDFFHIVAWNKLADFIGKHFQKGQLVTLDGKLRTRGYTDKNSNKRVATEVAAEHIYFTGSKNSSTEDTEQAAAAPASLASSKDYADLVNDLNNMGNTDDDYPF